MIVLNRDKLVHQSAPTAVGLIVIEDGWPPEGDCRQDDDSCLVQTLRSLVHGFTITGIEQDPGRIRRAPQAVSRCPTDRQPWPRGYPDRSRHRCACRVAASERLVAELHAEAEALLARLVADPS